MQAIVSHAVQGPRSSESITNIRSVHQGIYVDRPNLRSVNPCSGVNVDPTEIDPGQPSVADAKIHTRMDSEAPRVPEVEIRPAQRAALLNVEEPCEVDAGTDEWGYSRLRQKVILN